MSRRKVEARIINDKPGPEPGLADSSLITGSRSINVVSRRGCISDRLTLSASAVRMIRFIERKAPYKWGPPIL